MTSLHWQINNTSGCGVGCANWHIYIHDNNGLGFSPCNPCTSANNASAMSVAYTYQYMFNGPNYTSNNPVYMTGLQLCTTEFGCLNNAHNAGANYGGPYLKSGAPPPNNSWVSFSKDCWVLHSATSTC